MNMDDACSGSEAFPRQLRSQTSATTAADWLLQMVSGVCRADDDPIFFCFPRSARSINSTLQEKKAAQHVWGSYAVPLDKMAEVPSRRNVPKRKVREVSEDSLPPAKKKQLDDYSNHENTSGRQHAYLYGGKRKPSHAAPKEHKYPSVNELKRRIRDVKRLLNRVDLPADARVVQERALVGYEKELQDELNRRQKSEMISRYHFVRFLGMLYHLISICTI